MRDSTGEGVRGKRKMPVPLDTVLLLVSHCYRRPFSLLTSHLLFVIPYFMTSGILFDFNGVIVDDESQHCDALTATLAEYGYDLNRDSYYQEYLGYDDRECFRFTFERMGRPSADG